MADKEDKANDLENAVSKGKKDWMNYEEKRKQIKEDRKADTDNNKEKAEKVAKHKLDKRVSPTSGGFGLG